MTAQGAASIDMEDKTKAVVTSVLQQDGTNCPLDSTFLNELDGVVYVVCVNGTSFANLLKVNVGDRTASVAVSLPIVNLELDEKLIIASLSPDRRHSSIFLLHLDSQGNVAALYVVHSEAGASGRLSISAGYNGPDVSRIRYWSGVDSSYIYTLEGDSNYAFLTRRDPGTLKVVAYSRYNFTTSKIVSSSADAGTSQALVWTQDGIFSFPNGADFNKPTFACARTPSKDSCGNWKLTGNSLVSGGSFFAAGNCQTQSTTYNIVFRALLSTNDGCPGQCTGHGACWNSSCLCFDGYTERDCSRGKKSNGCGISCNTDNDCLVDPPWNFCPVCWKGKCQPVCTTPCESSQQCRQWGSHSVLAGQCVTCNRVYHFCEVDTIGCPANCYNSNDCQSPECPRCTVEGSGPRMGTCVK